MFCVWIFAPKIRFTSARPESYFGLDTLPLRKVEYLIYEG